MKCKLTFKLNKIPKIIINKNKLVKSRLNLHNLLFFFFHCFSTKDYYLRQDIPMFATGIPIMESYWRNMPFHGLPTPVRKLAKLWKTGIEVPGPDPMVNTSKG